MTMIERVARAICNECNDQPYDALPETATYLERKTHVGRAMLDKQEARQVARAAIEAMREPTDAMVDVGQDAFAEGINMVAGHPEPSDEASYQTYIAMIDAALNEQVSG